MNAWQFNRLFDTHWTGSLARFAVTLRCETPTRASIALSKFFDPARAPTLLNQLSCFSGAPIDDHAALVSEWSKKWLGLFLMHWIWLLHTHHRIITCSSAASYLVCGPNGLPERMLLEPRTLQLPEITLDTIADVRRAYDPMLCALEFAFRTLAAYGRINIRVLWNNAANIIEATLTHIGLHRSSVRLAYRFLLETDDPNRDSAPMYHAIQYVPTFHADLGDPIRLRRLCCLRYRLENRHHCVTCPRLKTMTSEQINILLEKWREH